MDHSSKEDEVEFCRDISNKFRWYAVKVYAGQEESLVKRILEKISKNESNNFTSVKDVKVAARKHVFSKNGKEMIKKKIVWPGYIFINTDFSDEVRDVIRELRGVFDFVGGSKPAPMSIKEIEYINEIGSEKEEYLGNNKFAEGDVVTIVSGPLSNTSASVVENLPGGKVRVRISIFGRSNLIDLEIDQIESE